MKPKLVLDSSGVIRSNLDFTKEFYAMPGSVLEELSSNSRDAVDYGIRIGRVSIKEPGEASRKAAIEAATSTGDIKALSRADLDVLALALEYGIPLISDDYAVQNTAAKLGVEFKTTFHDGIKKKVTWVFTCSGCKREYDSKTSSCSVCGSKVVRKGVNL